MTDFIWGANKCVPKLKDADDSDSDDSDDVSIYRSQNEIWFNHGVAPKSIDKLIKLVYEIIHDEKLSAYRENNNLEIIIHFDSLGGYVDSAFKFIDFVGILQKKNIKFRSIINGRACSSATLMAIVCDKKQITKHSYAMLHEMSSMTSGSITHLRSYQKHLDMAQDHIITAYTDNNKNITKAELEELMLKETWFSAQDYKLKGFVDEIL
jgi:ATP-dependent protease ClpP protease subunit